MTTLEVEREEKDDEQILHLLHRLIDLDVCTAMLKALAEKEVTTLHVRIWGKTPDSMRVKISVA